MDKPRLFLGSSASRCSCCRRSPAAWKTSHMSARGRPSSMQERRLSDACSSYTREVDFARVRVRGGRLDQYRRGGASTLESTQASPRDNVVFEAGLFGGVLGMRRTSILHAKGAKLSSDPLGPDLRPLRRVATAADIKVMNQKLRKAIDSEIRVPRIDGLWWQYSLTERSASEPSAVSRRPADRARSPGWDSCSPVAPGRRTARCRPGTGAKPPAKATTARRSSTLEGRAADGPERPATGRHR